MITFVQKQTKIVKDVWSRVNIIDIGFVLYFGWFIVHIVVVILYYILK